MIMCVMLAMLFGCKTKYITIPEYHTEYAVRTDTLMRVDSLVRHDSVSVMVSGDTIRIERYFYRDETRYLYRTKTDTLLRSDTIRVPYPVERTVSAWERTYDRIGRWALWSLAGTVFGYTVVWLIRKKMLR